MIKKEIARCESLERPYLARDIEVCERFGVQLVNYED